MELGSAQIIERLAALAMKVEGLEGQVRLLAYDAVIGDETARTKLAEVNAQIAQAAADRKVLEHARATAFEREAAAIQAAEEAKREGHMNAAREHISTLIGLAAKADTMIRDFYALSDEVTNAENSIRKELRAAGRDSDIANGVGVAHRKGLVGIIRGFMDTHRDPGNFDDRRAEDLARAAWREFMR